MGDHYQRVMNENVERTDLLLESLLGYLKVSAPIKKTNTVHAIMEETLRDHQAKLEEKAIEILRIFEENLPETIVPREHLNYILNSVFQYVLSLMPYQGSAELVTRSFTLKFDDVENRVSLMKDRRYIEILFTFSDDNRPRELSTGATELPLIRQREGLDLMLRLVKDVVERNQGIWKLHSNEKEKKSTVSLKFPAERRKVVSYSFPERKREKEELRLSEKKLQRPVENGSQATYYSTFDGRYVNAHSALARILGYESSGELAGAIKNIANQIYVNPNRHSDLVRLLRERGAIQGFESRVRRKDGTVIWISENARVVADGNKTPICYEGTVQDITEQKRLEARHIQSQKMEVVKKMAAGLAHDFNNILTAILGNADLLLYELRPQDPACSGITAIKESAERASKVTGKLLTLSQGQVIHPEILNLNDLIAGMEKRLKDVLGQNITYDPVLEPDLRSVKADRLQVEQVILNLVSNAKEAMPEGGGLKISTENTHPDEKYSAFNPEVVPGGYVLVSVSDTGIGIPPRMMGHLFEPFFTVKPSGRGLGLALVYSIVKQAGGHIAVSSKEKRGTTV